MTTTYTAPLNRAFNVAVNHIASKICPQGYDVANEAPQTYDALITHYATTGRVLVWNGGDTKNIYGCLETLCAFRAWHDSKHIKYELPFTYAGELEALKCQQDDIRAIYDGTQADTFCLLIEAEIKGSFDYNEKYGGFPTDQLGFVQAYVAGWALATVHPQFGRSVEQAIVEAGENTHTVTRDTDARPATTLVDVARTAGETIERNASIVASADGIESRANIIAATALDSVGDIRSTDLTPGELAQVAILIAQCQRRLDNLRHELGITIIN